MVDISLKYARVRGLFIVFIITVLFGAMFFVLWSGAKMVESGAIRPGDLVTFITITAIVGGALASLGDFYTQMLRAVGASERIMTILNYESEVNMEQEVAPLALDGVIDFQSVKFSYPSRPDIEVLKGLNLHIEAGHKIALVGASGAGKSTIVQLILRFYQLNEGKILVDQKPLEDYNITQLRQNIAIVPQEVILFGGSIRENIAYGRHNATEEEIIAAAQKAMLGSLSVGFLKG